MWTTHTFSSNRHTTGYLSCGDESSPLLIFLHGWPELSHSWRHQLPVFAAMGFRCIAPDMRGYGRSSTYARVEDFELQTIVADMLELLAALGHDRAVWIGHDCGSYVAWNIAAHHPEKTAGVANLCVPYLSGGFTLDNLVPLVDRSIYPEADYPFGQWDYQVFYEEQFDRACRTFEADIRGLLKLLFRKGDPRALGRPAPLASVRKAGGWFNGGACPDLPRDGDVITEQDLEVYVTALTAKGFFGPDAWYMNREANGAYARMSAGGGKLRMPVLFMHAAYDIMCETLHSRLAGPMRRDCSDLTEVTVKAGHWMAQEQPAAVNAALAKWLALRLPDYWAVGSREVDPGA